jgi:thioredoxin 1
MADIRAKFTSAMLTMLVAFTVMPALAAVSDIYPAPAQAKIDLAAALARSAATHKRVIVDFGGNWCSDCHVLDAYFHDSTNKPLLEANYILPALAVLGEHGELLYSQKAGEFEAMRSMQSAAVTGFLLRWKLPP